METYTAYTKHANVTVNNIRVEECSKVRKVFFDFICNATIPSSEFVIGNLPHFKWDAQITVIPYSGSGVCSAVYNANGRLAMFNCQAGRYIFEMIGFAP